MWVSCAENSQDNGNKIHISRLQNCSENNNEGFDVVFLFVLHIQRVAFHTNFPGFFRRIIIFCHTKMYLLKIKWSCLRCTTTLTSKGKGFSFSFNFWHLQHILLIFPYHHWSWWEFNSICRFLEPLIRTPKTMESNGAINSNTVRIHRFEEQNAELNFHQDR